MKITKLGTLLLIAAGLAAAQTTNYTFTLDGSNCSVYGCSIQPTKETDSAWGSPLPAYPPSSPFWYVSAHAMLTTGLPVKIGGYPTAASIPTNVSGTGSATINWFIGNGQSGSFTVDLNCTWVANGKVGTYPRFLETCQSSMDAQGESAPFTRDWYATPGPRGGWNLFVLNMPASGIVPVMTLTAAVPNQSAAAASEPVEIYF